MILTFLLDDPSYPVIYTLSLHDALPICGQEPARGDRQHRWPLGLRVWRQADPVHTRSQRRHGLLWCTGDEPDRKSTRLNSSHVEISYAVFCLKKKKNMRHMTRFIDRVLL